MLELTAAKTIPKAINTIPITKKMIIVEFQVGTGCQDFKKKAFHLLGLSSVLAARISAGLLMV
jgi:hypothetical protein